MSVPIKLPHSPTTPQISTNGVLSIWGFGVRLQIRNGQLCAEWGIGRDRHSICLPRANRNLKRVVVIGSSGFASFDAIRWVSDIGASLIFLDRRGKLLFASTPTAPSDVRLRRSQCLALENGTALKISREIVARKIEGHAAIVRNMLDNSVAAEAILRFKAELAETENIDAVRLAEALAAKIYWSQWVNQPIPWVRKDEARVPANWKRFTSRMSSITHTARLATDPVNACMNLLHGLCEAECRIALITTGLDPEIGLMHRDAPSRSSAANDLQEILRPSVDSWVLHWIQTEPFRKADFWEDKNGNCRVGLPLAKKLCETADTWRKFAAPVAEWLAQAIWNSARNVAKREQVLPTRLTQRRKSEGRGHAFTMRANITFRHPKICAVCGAEDVTGRHCRECATEAARRTMADIASLSHMKPKSKKEKARVSSLLSNHAVANTWWDPSSLPSWLTEECYVQRIQPLLRTKKVREIAAAIQVSELYAGFIRSGRRRPHPRHWRVLATLAGFR